MRAAPHNVTRNELSLYRVTLVEIERTPMGSEHTCEREGERERERVLHSHSVSLTPLALTSRPVHKRECGPRTCACSHACSCLIHHTAVFVACPPGLVGLRLSVARRVRVCVSHVVSTRTPRVASRAHPCFTRRPRRRASAAAARAWPSWRRRCSRGGAAARPPWRRASRPPRPPPPRRRAAPRRTP